MTLRVGTLLSLGMTMYGKAFVHTCLYLAVLRLPKFFEGQRAVGKKQCRPSAVCRQKGHPVLCMAAAMPLMLRKRAWRSGSRSSPSSPLR